MKAHLLFPDRDLPPPSAPGPVKDAIARDLGLEAVFDAMAGGDRVVREVVERVVLGEPISAAAVRYRQDALEDCLREPAAVRELYEIVAGALDAEHQIWGFSERSPSSVLYRALRVMDLFLAALTRVGQLAERHGSGFRSEAFTGLVAAIRSEIDPSFFAEATAHLQRLRERDSLLLSTRVGPAAKPEGWTLRTPRATRPSLWRRLLPHRSAAHTVVIADRDETGHRLLGELIDRGLAPSAAALGRSAEHLLQFLQALRLELSLYVGALNLEDRLRQLGVPACRPTIVGAAGPSLDIGGVYDLGLAVRTAARPVPNDVAAQGRRLVLITGANQGGKSTLLRALGIAQLFAQAGLRVPADRCSTGIASGVFTHFRREEDPSMLHGKLEEELARLRDLVGQLRPGGLLLCNESLSSTNEREGSEIATEVVRALVETGVTVFFVTFLFEFADAWFRQGRSDTLFLRVERLADGSRTFRLVPGPPLPTGFAEDLGPALGTGGALTASGRAPGGV